MEHVVEATEQGFVHQAKVVGGSDDEAVGGVLFDELKQGIQHSAHLADVVVEGAVPGDGVELVEEIDARDISDEGEDGAELRTGLAHELGDEAVDLDGVKREAKLVGEDAGCEGLTGAGWAAEESVASALAESGTRDAAKAAATCAVKRHDPLEWKTPAGGNRVPAENLK
jgi:hypothetical protein